METIGYFNYEIFDIPKENKTDDVFTKVFKILFDDFDLITKLLIIEALFNSKPFDVEEFAYQFRTYKEMKKK